MTTDTFCHFFTICFNFINLNLNYDILNSKLDKHDIRSKLCYPKKT